MNLEEAQKLDAELSDRLAALISDNEDLFREMYNRGDGAGGFLVEFIGDALGIKKPMRKGYRKGKISAAARWTVFERDGRICRHCGSRDDLTIDHIIPESKGGSRDVYNLQVLCRSCNSKKGTKCEIQS